MATPMERIYGPLAAYLAARAAAGEGRVVLPFATLEGAVLGRPLPRTARHPRGYRQWWTGHGTGFPHAWYGWQRAGWTVEAIDLAAETVTFLRTGGAAERAVSQTRRAGTRPCMRISGTSSAAVRDMRPDRA